MKIIKSIAAAILAGSLSMGAAAAQENATGTLLISFENIEPQTGIVYVGLFQGEENFKSSNALTGRAVQVNAPRGSVSIEGLAPGEYGFKLYHDINGNGQLDTGNMGIPTEPWAFSNNAKPRFGPPSWADAKFTVSTGTVRQSVKLRGGK